MFLDTLSWTLVLAIYLRVQAMILVYYAAMPRTQIRLPFLTRKSHLNSPGKSALKGYPGNSKLPDRRYLRDYKEPAFDGL